MLPWYEPWCFILYCSFVMWMCVVGQQHPMFDTTVELPLPFITVAEAEGGVKLTSCPKNITVTTDAGKPYATVTWKAPLFKDKERSTVISSRSHKPGTRFSTGVVVVKYSVALKGTPTCSFAVNVKDAESPQIFNCPTDQTLPANMLGNSAAQVTWTVPRATDNVQVTSFESDYTSGSSFGLGRTAVTYHATDAYKNTAECSFSISITDEHPPASLECPTDISEFIGPTETRKPVGWSTPVFSDNSGSPTVTSTHTSGELFQLGHTAVVYTATDPSGNTNICSFHVMLKVHVPDTRVFVRHITMTEIEITWAQTMNETASSYLVYVWSVGSKEPLASDHVYHPINKLETFATLILDRLFPGIQYNIRVVITGIGVQLNTRQRTKPNPPGSFTVRPDTLTPVSLKLIWQTGGGAFDQYQLSYKKSGSEILSTLRHLDKSTTSFQINGLEPGTSYVFKVVAISGPGKTSTSSSPRVLSVTTESIPEDKILLTNVTSTSVSLLCRFPQVKTPEEESADRGYIVVIYSDINDVFTDVVFDAWPLSYQFQMLKPTTYYHIRVISNEMGTYFETSVRTRPKSVTEVWISSITNSSATLKWNHVNQRDNYEIRLTPNYQRLQLPIKTSENEISLRDLIPKATYTVTVETVYTDLRSDPMVILVTPGVDTPTPITKPKGLSCIGPIISACCLAAILALIVLYLIKRYISIRGKKIPSHHAEENEYENPQRPNSIYSQAQYQNPSRRTSAASREGSNNSSSIYPPLPLRIIPRIPKILRHGFVENGSGDDIPMYYNMPYKPCPLPD